MEFYDETENEQDLDLFIILEDFLKAARRHLILGLVLIVLGAGILGVRGYLSYHPVYQAHASFTVKVANPLYATVSTYNTKTAEQMAATFPHVLTSGVLQARIREHLGIPFVPPISVTANSTTSIITMTVTDSDPQRAYDVLRAVILYYPEIAEYVVGSTVLVLLDESGVPTAPINSFNVTDGLKTGALLGAGVWAVLMAALAFLKNTVRSEEELKKVINSPCLTQVPNVKISARKGCPLITTHAGHPGFSESIRLLRIRAEKALSVPGRNVLLISSAIPGEGKTTISVNLALSLARKGNRVLLMDCDLRNPSVAKALHLSAEKSLADFIAGTADTREILLPSGIDNLYIVSGGSGKNAGAAEVLAHKRTATLLQAARSRFDYVILDTPPCSLLADASEVAELADYGLLVIRQDFASRTQILDGAQRLGDCGLPIMGCVLNGVRKSLSSRYGYDYGYGYGYGYGSRKQKKVQNDTEPTN